MSTGNPNVKCTVDQCTHWMDDQCMAAKIGIYNDEVAGESEKSADTLCKSFHAAKGVGDMIGGLHNANIVGTMKAAFVDGTQMTPSVECYVTNCNYWQKGNYCEAPSIEVAGSNAAKNEDTDCATFTAR